MEITPKPWKPDGPHMLILYLAEGKPVRKKFYGVEARLKFLDTIAYFKNEADRDLFLAAPDLLEACESVLAEQEYGQPDRIISPELENEIKAIIAKARGE